VPAPTKCGAQHAVRTALAQALLAGGALQLQLRRGRCMNRSNKEKQLKKRKLESKKKKPAKKNEKKKKKTLDP
jgi:hypothetical protein